MTETLFPVCTVAHTRQYTGSHFDAVYVARPSIFGNPFKIGAAPLGHGTREEVIEAFRLWWYLPAQADLRTKALRDLPGKVLLCWCTPKDCHAGVIAQYVNWHVRGGKCLGCASVGFEPSVLGAGRCTFCDGTEAGLDPHTGEALSR